MTSAPKFLAMAALLLLGTALGGCESMTGWSGGSEPKTNEPMDITVNNTNLDQAPGLQQVPNFPPPGDRDLRVMTSKLSGGSVEIYDLESGAPDTMGAPVPAVQPIYNGIPLATDPSVTVYPLDGGGMMPPPVYAGSGAPQQWPNAVLPSMTGGAAGMTPAPAQWGGEERMEIVDGKLSPRMGSGMSSVYFRYGSARLGSPERGALRDVAEAAKFAPVDRVNVEGHASRPAQTNDPIKAKILNLKESMNRAQAVSENLIQNGVPAEKIKAVGWGDTKQIAGSEAEQRRVDIITGMQ